MVAKSDNQYLIMTNKRPLFGIIMVLCSGQGGNERQKKKTVRWREHVFLRQVAMNRGRMLQKYVSFCKNVTFWNISSFSVEINGIITCQSGNKCEFGHRKHNGGLDSDYQSAHAQASKQASIITLSFLRAQILRIQFETDNRWTWRGNTPAMFGGFLCVHHGSAADITAVNRKRR